MKIKKWFKKLAKAKSNKKICTVFADIVTEFQAESSEIGHLAIVSEEFDSGLPDITFTRTLSEDCMTTIAPIIDDGALRLWITTYQLRGAKREVVIMRGTPLNWAINPDLDDDFQGISHQVATQAITQHQRLLEFVGVPQGIAEHLARDRWAADRARFNAGLARIYAPSVLDMA